MMDRRERSEMPAHTGGGIVGTHRLRGESPPRF